MDKSFLRRSDCVKQAAPEARKFRPFFALNCVLASGAKQKPQFECAEMQPCCFSFLVFPGLKAVLDPAFVIPDVVAEIAAALWLAFKGVRLTIDPMARKALTGQIP